MSDGGRKERRDGAFYLNDVLLSPLGVYPSAQCVPRENAGQIVRFAGRYVRYAHVLRAKRNKVADRRIVVALDVRAKKLPPW